MGLVLLKGTGTWQRDPIDRILMLGRAPWVYA